MAGGIVLERLYKNKMYWVCVYCEEVNGDNSIMCSKCCKFKNKKYDEHEVIEKKYEEVDFGWD